MAVEAQSGQDQLAGLSQAEVRQRISRGEVNTIPEGPSRTTAEIVRANVITRFNILLSVLLVVILVAVGEPADALFGIVLVTNAAIGIVQELRAKKTLDRLSVLTTPRVRVVRDGTSTEIPVQTIVLDDVIEMRSGDQVAVDGEVIAARGLEINESLLTGESDPVAKSPGDEVLSGSFVSAGTGSYRATRVGENAYAATLAQEAKRFTLVRSELRDGVNWIIGAVSWVVGPVIILLIWSSLRAQEADQPIDADSIRVALSSAVAGAVGMIPQGLVLLTSIALAVGVIRLGRRNVLVQELPAIEGLARVDTVCFDKTGTLTEGTLVVQDIQPLTDLDPAPPLGALGAAEPDPNATLQAIVARFPAKPGWQADTAVPFSSARKWSGATFGHHGTWVLGAPEILVPGNDTVIAAAEDHAALGRRVVLLAHSPLRLQGEKLPRRLQPEALVILGDKIRQDAEQTLRYFAQQNVQIKVISGDHPHTVAAIAREVGIPGSAEVVDARDLPEDSDEFADEVEAGTVFGRVTPHQKQLMVTALQSRGHVVAMTGDGVNDVLALKDSDIGIAIGSGSSASRSVAQLVLIDGSFATLPSVVGEGRRVIGNIERVANLFVTKTIYAIFIAVAIGLAARQFPFLPRHLTLVGSITIGIPAFFLALAPNAERARPGFLHRVLRFAIPIGLAAGLATFFAYELSLSEGVTLPKARTVATLVLAAIGLFAIGIVARPLIAWKKWLIASMAVFLLFVLAMPFTQEFFDLAPPRPAILLAGVGIVAITGAIIVGSLRALGWIRNVPEILRERPPDAGKWWRQIKDQAESLIGHSPPPLDDAAFVDTPDPVASAATPDPAPDPVPGPEIDWFDPDLDPVEAINEPPTPSSS